MFLNKRKETQYIIHFQRITVLVNLINSALQNYNVIRKEELLQVLYFNGRTYLIVWF